MAEKILIVDDDIDSLKLIGLMLQRQGYEIGAANAGAQALSKAAAETPDLIILDVMMPDMDGYEVCRRLRADPNTQNIPIIMFTAKTLVDDKVAGFEAGADDYLTKPTHPAELASRVKAVLARSAAKRGASAEQGTLIGVLGVKGGVGTTTIATNLASALNKKETAILADLRPGQGSLSVAMGFARATGLANLMTRPPADINARSVSGEITSHSSGLRLLLSSIRPKEAQVSMTPDVAEAIVRQLRNLSQLVIVDLGTGLGPVNQRILRDVSHLLIVVDPQRVTLTMSRALQDALGELGLGQGRTSIIMVNRTHSSLQVSWQEAEQILGRDMQAIVSPAPELAFQANEAGVPIMTLQPGAIVSSQYQKLADELAAHLRVGKTA
jgi:DNA-binding response OmpR family regulator